MSTSPKSSSEAEQLLRENAQLRGDLLTIGSRFSHDLLTPLGGISISIQLLKETLPANNPSATLAMDSLSSSVNEIKELAESVSLLAKATARPRPKERVDMGEIVLTVQEELAGQTAKQGATLTTPETWPELEGVPAWIEFIWRSFLNDALRRGGLKIQLGWSRQKKAFHFWMTDNGRPVPAETGAEVFKPFDSLRGLDSTSGLGLSIARRLAELQGGHCAYETATNGGPRLSFTLPL